MHFQRLDGNSPDVTVYLDGYQYHAAAHIPGQPGNRIAGDAEKRASLRLDDYRVFQVTSADVERWRADKPCDDNPY